jgi:hypothetical protein
MNILDFKKKFQLKFDKCYIFSRDFFWLVLTPQFTEEDNPKNTKYKQAVNKI